MEIYVVWCRTKAPYGASLVEILPGLVPVLIQTAPGSVNCLNSSAIKLSDTIRALARELAMRASSYYVPEPFQFRTCETSRDGT